MSIDYRVGDRVERFQGGSHNQMKIGDTGIVTEISYSTVTVRLDRDGYLSDGHSPENLKLFKPDTSSTKKYQWKAGDKLRVVEPDSDLPLGSIVTALNNICTDDEPCIANVKRADGIDDNGRCVRRFELITPKELIKDNMDTRVENIEPSVLKEAQAQALKEIKEEQSLRAKQYFKEQYAKKTELERQRAKKQLEIDAIDKELAEVLKGLKAKK